MPAVNWVPWHGLVGNGELELPYGAGALEYPDPNELRIGFYGASTKQIGNAFLLRKQGAPASIVRTPSEQSEDEALGRQWLTYALMSGNKNAINGTTITAGFGDCGWIYFDPNGVAWQIKATMSTDGNNGPNPYGYRVSARLNYQVRRFGTFDNTAHVDSDYQDAYGDTELYLLAGQHFIAGITRIVAKNSDGSKALWGIWGADAVEATGADQDWPVLWVLSTVSGVGSETAAGYGLLVTLTAITGGQAAAAQYPGVTTYTKTGTSLYGCWSLTKPDFPKEIAVTWHIDGEWCYVPPPAFQPEPNGNSIEVTETNATLDVKLWGVFAEDDTLRWLTSTSILHFYYSNSITFSLDGPTLTREGEVTAFQKANRTQTSTIYGYSTRTRRLEWDGTVLWEDISTELNPANHSSVTVDQLDAVFGLWYGGATCHNTVCSNGSANSSSDSPGYPGFDYWFNGLVEKPDGTFWRYFAVRYSDQVVGTMEVTVATDGTTWTSATLHDLHAPDVVYALNEPAIQFLVQPMKYSGGVWSGRFATWHPVNGTIASSNYPVSYV